MAGLASGFRQHGIDALAVGRPRVGRLGLGAPLPRAPEGVPRAAGTCRRAMCPHCAGV